MNPIPISNSPKSWSQEKLYFRGDEYFHALLASISRAKKSVDLETYIYEPGKTGDKILKALMDAARRGVKVRLMVDGVGSADFVSHYGSTLAQGGVTFKVYRSWPVFFSTAYHRFRLIQIPKSLQKLSALWNSGKHRDHRKMCLVDGREAWLGSFNVSDWHLEKIKGKSAWRDNGLRLSGVKTLAFRLAFDATWADPWPRHSRHLYRHSLVQWLSQDIEGGPLRVTANRKLRIHFRRELVKRILAARKRVWVTTPYFVPPRGILKALRKAARKGCDVRFILPAVSDVPMVRWASMTFYPALLKSGCRIFEYQGRVLHAKAMILDDWMLMGSGNLDYRSLRKDLEVNVIPQMKESRKILEGQFKKDQAASRELTLGELHQRPFWERFLSWVFFHYRFWF